MVVYALLGVVGVLALITLPLGANDDGSTRRLISKVSGRNNSTVVSGDQSPVEVTRILTSEHINSLAVKVFLLLTLTPPYDTDMLIKALDTLLSPYYEHISTSNWDYQYMSSTGVCQDGQLGAVATEPYQFI
jgi:hypothetical protein